MTPFRQASLAASLAIALATVAPCVAQAQNADSTGFSSGGVPSVSGVWNPSTAALQMETIINNVNNNANNATSIANNATNVANNATNVANYANGNAAAALSEASQALGAAGSSGFAAVGIYSTSSGASSNTTVGLCAASPGLNAPTADPGLSDAPVYNPQSTAYYYNPSSSNGGTWDTWTVCPASAPWFYPVFSSTSTATQNNCPNSWSCMQ
jgi:hypothetical protein